ncbi:hypothetical protein Tco_0646711 [Tanacetum coccineum]
MLSKFVNSNTASSLSSGSLPSNTITNPKDDLKGITTRSGVAYQGPTIPTTSSHKVVERRTDSEKGRDVNVKVGVFQFLANFVVVDFEPDPRVPLILRICFLKTGRALIDVYEGELTLRVDNEAITYNLDQTSRYSVNYNDMTANRIDVVELAYEEYSQEVLGFFDVIASGNPTPGYDPIVSNSSPTLTPFGDSDFLLLEEADAFLALADDPTSPEVDESYYDPEGDILILEALLNIELKDLPPHLEYAFLEDNNKFPVIIAKDLSVDEKTALIKKEVEKLLDAGLIYPISDSPWVNPVHCVPKKGGMTVVTKDENELVPTRLVTGWRVCIDYLKLNEATRKDHFPLSFMDQILERLGQKMNYYCSSMVSRVTLKIPIDRKIRRRPYSLPHTERLAIPPHRPFGLWQCSKALSEWMMGYLP